MNRVNIDNVSFEVCKAYKYALIYNISEIIFKECNDISEMDFNQCLEAYFFDKTGQIHLFRTDNDELKAIKITDEKDNEVDENVVTVDREFEIEPKWLGNNKTLVKREYLKADEDGQMCVTSCRLYDVKEGE
ncbi:MAG: hypothetical protein K6G11_06085 [Lachnospiraceae bacterium]|nr:hypothetical protein [Lachnospiraceae bacterium]